MHRLLSPVLAGSALAYLGLHLAAAKVGADWLHTWAAPGTTEASVRISRIGPQWDHPPMPKQPWVAGDPPPYSRPLLSW